MKLLLKTLFRCQVYVATQNYPFLLNTEMWHLWIILAATKVKYSMWLMILGMWISATLKMRGLTFWRCTQVLRPWAINFTLRSWGLMARGLRERTSDMKKTSNSGKEPYRYFNNLGMINVCRIGFVGSRRRCRRLSLITRIGLPALWEHLLKYKSILKLQP